jgi:heme O synthase-like polyprenyltransferase
MKNKPMSAFFMLLASICYFFSTWLTISEGTVSGYRFYLQFVTGFLFLVASIRIFMKSRIERAAEKDIESE